MKNKLLAIAMLMAALAPAVAVADLSEAPAQKADAAENGRDQAVFRQLLDLSHEAKVSLAEAIATAEKLHDGSRTSQIGFEEPGRPEFKVRTVRGDLIWDNTIDARTGRVIGKEKVFSPGELSTDDRRDIKALKHVLPELAEAIAFAEKEVGGKAVGASMIDEDGMPNFAVVVITGDQLKQVMLEARRNGGHVASHRAHRN